jgi:hypothetical protein
MMIDGSLDPPLFPQICIKAQQKAIFNRKLQFLSLGTVNKYISKYVSNHFLRPVLRHRCF